MEPRFAPQLFIPPGTRDIRFYEDAFGAVVLRSFPNEDGSIHVAELSFGGTLFHLHESTPGKQLLPPATLSGTSVVIGVFVDDVHSAMRKALGAGAAELSAVHDYPYGYRQGTLRDPFGHVWTLQQNI